MIAISITCHGRMRENNLEIVLSDGYCIPVEILLGPGVGTRLFLADSKYFTDFVSITYRYTVFNPSLFILIGLTQTFSSHF